MFGRRQVPSLSARERSPYLGSSTICIGWYSPIHKIIPTVIANVARKQNRVRISLLAGVSSAGMECEGTDLRFWKKADTKKHQAVADMANRNSTTHQSVGSL